MTRGSVIGSAAGGVAPGPRIEWHQPADIGSELGADHRHDDLIARAPGQVRFCESGGSGPFKDPWPVHR